MSLRSLSDHRRATRVGPDDNDYDDYALSLRRLHEIAWRGNSQDLFHPISVTSDAQRVEDELPENPMVLRWDSDSTTKELTEYTRAVLVRDEYRSMLQDIINTFWWDGDGANQGGNDRGDAPAHMDAEPIHNPFVGLPSQKRSGSGGIVIGNPGIGKSLFLFYVLALRLLAGQPTTFQKDKKSSFVLNDEGVFEFPGGFETKDDLHRYVPGGTWFLVDSNRYLTDVPPIYDRLAFRCPGFILQAASPRGQRVQWWKKAPRPVVKFWMKPWTVGELIVGLDLQSWEADQDKPSAQDIADFAKLYGTSARQVYSCGANQEIYKELIEQEIKQLDDLTKLNQLVNNAHAVAEDEKISHLFLEVTPRPGDRTKYNVNVATDYLWRKLKGGLDKTLEHKANELYQQYVKDPVTRGLAGRFLECAVLVEFPKGGEWPMTAMKKRPPSKINTHWKSDDTKPCRYLRLGCQGRNVTIANGRIDASVEKFEYLPRYPFSRKTSELKDGFYAPDSDSQPSFDAFVYEAGSRRATIFQVTGSPKHEISTLGLKQLHDCGAKSIRLVVITPPIEEGSVLDISAANSDRDKLSEVYHLVVPKTGILPRSQASGRNIKGKQPRTRPIARQTDIGAETSSVDAGLPTTEPGSTATGSRSAEPPRKRRRAKDWSELVPPREMRDRKAKRARRG